MVEIGDEYTCLIPACVAKKVIRFSNVAVGEGMLTRVSGERVLNMFAVRIEVIEAMTHVIVGGESRPIFEQSNWHDIKRGLDTLR